MKKYISEFVGTFCLVFCGTGSIVANEVSNGAVTQLGIALSFGLIVMIMVYALGDISGPHMNPAVSFAFLANKELPLHQFVKYVVSQTAGAFFASLSLKLLFPLSANLGATVPFGTDIQSFVLEVFLTAMLMFVVVRLGDAQKLLSGNIVGAVIALEALFAGPISGASMNPARSLAPALVSGNHASLWIYLTAPFIGSFLGMKLGLFLNKPTGSV